MAPTFLLLLGTSLSFAIAQSSNPNIGHNPNAQGATDEVTPGSGPNGLVQLRTQFRGWNPPFLDFTSLYHINRPEFYNGVGGACAQYDSYFQKAGDGHGIDPTTLAFIAMQESSCQADAVGPTPGLMQVSCENYPNGVCTDSLQDNVDAGATYLRSQLDATGNNAIAAIGAYNGWFQGMTQDYPCSNQGKANRLPQNLDYLQQTLNGWFTGQDVYGAQNWIGYYKCSGTCDNGNLC